MPGLRRDVRPGRDEARLDSPKCFVFIVLYPEVSKSDRSIIALALGLFPDPEVAPKAAEKAIKNPCAGAKLRGVARRL
jgi:hypothetical protein